MEIRALNVPLAPLVPAGSDVASRQPRPAEASAENVPVDTRVAIQASGNAQGASAQNKTADGNERKPLSQETMRQELEESLKKLNETVKLFNSDIRFVTDEDSGRQVVRIIDRDSKEVIRQIPSEEALAISKMIDRLQGLLIKDKA